MDTAQNDLLKKQKAVKKTIYLFTGIMIALTFFSNTFSNISLPRVKAEKSSGGTLLIEVSGQGTVEAKDVVNLYVDPNHKVQEVRVKPGDKVEKGQILVVLEKGSVENGLQEEYIKLEKYKLMLEKLELERQPADLSVYEKNLDAAQEKVAAAEKNLQAVKENSGDINVNPGMISQAEAVLKSAEADYKKAQADLDYARSQDAQRLKNLDIDIQNAKYDVQLQEIKIENLRKTLDFQNEIKSPVSGIIKALNYSVGMLTGSSLPLCTIINTGEGYTFTFSVDVQQADYIAIGDEADIKIKSLQGKDIKGKVIKIVDSQPPKEGKKDVVVDVDEQGLQDGMIGYGYVRKKTNYYEMLVPNSAVGEDVNGSFVYVLQEKKGVLGNQYNVQKAYITVGDSDDYKTGVTKGLTPIDKVVVESDRPLYDGQRVMIGE